MCLDYRLVVLVLIPKRPDFFFKGNIKMVECTPTSLALKEREDSPWEYLDVLNKHNILLD